VEEPEKKKVLVYESRVNYANSVCWSLENMKVPYTMVTNQNEFASSLYREEWFYVFSGYGLYEKIKPLMQQGEAVFCGGKKPHLALMIDWGNEAYIPNTRFVSIPVQSLSIANTLNGKADRQDNFEGSIKSGTIRRTFPNARLLVVDDIITNLKVTDGLLSPYKVKIDSCLSGTEAIELVKRNNYDLIFMDHMMPEMDGIEATASIRAWEKDSTRQQTPIIALTANAVVGMKEMFIENGFNDYLSKPIDVSKLDEILDRWLPEKGEIINKKEEIKNNMEQRIENKEQNQILAIPGIDMQKGIAMTGGKLDVYKNVLSFIYKDIEERLPLLQKTYETDLPLFTINVHALKSACANIGAMDASARALALETAGKDADMAFIRENLPIFIQQLTELSKNIRAFIPASDSL